MGWGWGTMLMPFIEQGGLYDALRPNTEPFHNDVAAGTPGEAQRILLRTPISTYRCPSDPGPEINSHRSSYGTSNYVAIWGANSGAGHQTNAGNGCMFYNSRINFRDILDGSSNVIVIGERALVNRAPQMPWRGAIYGGFRSTQWASVMRGVWDHPNHRINSNNITGTDAQWAYSSLHKGGAQFVLGDGSVRFISENINGITWQLIAQRASGEVVGEF